VIQADGGTRTASITGGCVALADAIRGLKDPVARGAFTALAASVSVGVWQGRPVLDLDYAEDSSADTDMNVVMLEPDGFIEVQGTAEGSAFSHAELTQLLDLARKGIHRLFELQRAALEA